jgi:hypothetical protein
MTTYKVVVDGSNIATEGRSLPSLNQLDEAVQCFIEEHPGADVLVIVDTSFAHRIDPTESEIFESAYNAGEIITPPAGTIGRGDSFILKVADKLGATVFSNDSFQEFHGTYDWLFERGRLIGGKPIPGLGWVFTDRTPVRGPKSREAVREAKRSQVRLGSPEASRPMPVPKGPPPSKKEEAAAAKQAKADAKLAAKSAAKPAKAVAKVDARVTPEPQAEARGDKRRRGRDRDRPQNTRPAEAPDSSNQQRAGRQESRNGDHSFVNESLPFVSFVSEHLPGTEVDGLVESYASHGFYVTLGDARGYVPLRGSAPEMPRSARDVARKGDTMTFIVRAFDAERRGIELALPGSPAASWVGSDEPEATPAREDRGREDRGRKGRRRRGGNRRFDSSSAVDAADVKPQDPSGSQVRQSTKPASTKAPAAKKAAVAPKGAAKAPAQQAAATAKTAKTGATKPAPAKKVAAIKVVAEKAAAIKAPAKKAPAKKAPAKKAPAKKAAVAKTSANKVAPAKAPAKKVAPAKAPAKKVSAVKTAAKKAAPAKAPAKKTAVKAPAKAAAKKVAAVKAPAKKAAVKAPAKKAAAKKSK